MKKTLIVSVILCLLPLLALAQPKGKTKKANRETSEWRYEIQNETVGADNTVVVCVWSYSKNVNVAYRQAAKNAVHGLLFKGAAANNDSAKRAKALPPIVKDPAAEIQHSDFFKTFFEDGGEYARYVTMTKTGSAVKFKKSKEYRVSVYVSVQYYQLQKRMQEAGIIKSLGDFFE